MKVHLFLSTGLAFAAFTGIFTNRLPHALGRSSTRPRRGAKAGRFPELALDVFQPMDGGIKLDRE